MRAPVDAVIAALFGLAIVACTLTAPVTCAADAFDGRVASPVTTP